MSDVLTNIAALEKFILDKSEELAKFVAEREDAAMMKGSIARATVLAKVDAVQTLQDDAAIFIETIPMAQREELLAEAITNTTWIYIEELSKAQQDVAMLRLEIGHKWPDPDVMDSYVFLVSEVGEVGDALLRSNYGHRGDYSRTRPDPLVDIAHELGDVYLMLCTLATALGIDLDEALDGCIDRLRSKHATTEPINNAQVR